MTFRPELLRYKGRCCCLTRALKLSSQRRMDSSQANGSPHGKFWITWDLILSSQWRNP